jgi:salicylate hydroxylase
MAIEDAATLAEALSLTPGDGSDREAIETTLKVYELLRKPRTSTLVDLAVQSAQALHLGAGNAREERDRQFAAAAKTGTAPVPDRWVSPEVQKMIYEHDCIRDTRERFEQTYKSVSKGIAPKL